MKRVEDYLQGREFIAGRFSLADCAVMPAIATLEALGLADETVTSDPLKAYAARLKQRKGFKGASLMTGEARAASS